MKLLKIAEDTYVEIDDIQAISSAPPNSRSTRQVGYYPGSQVWLRHQGPTLRADLPPDQLVEAIDRTLELDQP